MKILLLCYEYPPLGGGGGVAAQQYAEAWVRAGHEVTVVTSSAPGLSRREMVAGVVVTRVPTGGRKDRATTPFLSMLLYNLVGLAYVGLHRRELKTFDVINTHFSIPSGPMATIAARLLGLPNVLTIIGGDIYDPSKRSSPHRHIHFRLLNRWIINSADRVIAISSDTKRRAEEHYRIRRAIEVVNYGFTPLRCGSAVDLKPPLTPGKKFYLIGVGRLIRRKGFEILIRALTLLPADVELLLVGDGPLEGELRALATSEGVSSRVRFLGFQPRTAIHGLLRMCHCFVLPSLHEGLGIVVQEAMDAGLPVVGTDNGGQVDLIKEGRNGLLVKPGDVEGLAGAIRALYADPDRAAAMGRSNVEDVSLLYMDSNHPLYLRAFAEVTRGRRARGEKRSEVPDEARFSRT